MKAELERLRRENETLKKGASEGVRMKVSEKGGVSIYGMGRFPVTLYKEQWLKLLVIGDTLCPPAYRITERAMNRGIRSRSGAAFLGS